MIENNNCIPKKECRAWEVKNNPRFKLYTKRDKIYYTAVVCVWYTSCDEFFEYKSREINIFKP